MSSLAFTSKLENGATFYVIQLTCCWLHLQCSHYLLAATQTFASVEGREDYMPPLREGKDYMPLLREGKDYMPPLREGKD